MKCFWDYVDKSEECWKWTRCVLQNGYGQTFVDGKKKYAHRHAYELTKGKIPKGLHIDHLCRTRACVNPDHLEAVTLRENTQRYFEIYRRERVIPHGTIGTYSNHKCRCRKCKDINAEYSRNLKRKKKLAYGS